MSERTDEALPRIWYVSQAQGALRPLRRMSQQVRCILNLSPPVSPCCTDKKNKPTLQPGPPSVALHLAPLTSVTPPPPQRAPSPIPSQPCWPPSCFFLSLLRMLPFPPSQSNPIYPWRPSSNVINLTRSPQIFPAYFLPCSELKWQVAMDHTFVTHFEL